MDLIFFERTCTSYSGYRKIISSLKVATLKEMGTTIRQMAFLKNIYIDMQRVTEIEAPENSYFRVIPFQNDQVGLSEGIAFLEYSARFCVKKAGYIGHNI